VELDNLEFLGYFLIGLAFCSAGWGFCFLKLVDLFREAIEKKSRIKLWWALSIASFTLLLIIIGGSGIGIGIQQKKFQSIRMPIPSTFYQK
jgi:hypothetical protein